MSTSLARIDAAERALAEAQDLRDILEVRNKAEAVRSYVKARKKSLSVQNRAAAIKLMAERRAGALLAEMEQVHQIKLAMAEKVYQIQLLELLYIMQAVVVALPI